MKYLMSVVVLLSVACGGAGTKPSTQPEAFDGLVHDGEIHLADIRQLTSGQGENAEAYWSDDGKELIFQSARPPYACDQIFRMSADGKGEPVRVSTGTGRTTCAYFLPGNQEVVWSSTHADGPACPAVPDMSQGYVWPIYESYEIYVSGRNGENPRALTKNKAYDAEATVCRKDGSILFTSTRDGDLDIYRMDRDGKNVVRLTKTPGYDGGAFFSDDCKQIVWRASRPTGDALADYQRLLKSGLVRPTKLEIFVANADGSEARQITYLNAASFAPYLFPNGRRILFSTNYPNPRGREFDIWAINVDGSGLERITTAPGFDGFPMFSPDGKELVFASNRNQAKEGQTDVFVARWVESDDRKNFVADAADTFLSDVAWLADDAREGRGLGTSGIDEAAAWLEQRMRALRLDGGWTDGGYRQTLKAPVSVSVGPESKVVLGGQPLVAEDFEPAGFSSSGQVKGEVVDVGYGISAPELGHDDYKNKQVRGKIALIRRFVPQSKAFAKKENAQKYSDLHYKAFLARERGATAVLLYDAPEKGQAEAPLPAVKLERMNEIGIPAVFIKNESVKKAAGTAEVTVKLVRVNKPTYNVVGVVRAGADKPLPGLVVVGAHYDHLGFGDDNSLEPDAKGVHNGADDNASGTAGLLEVARVLSARKKELRRDVYMVAFTAEERGVIGSNFFVASPPFSLDNVVGMLNMDMIGRLRENKVAVIGGDTASEWRDLVRPHCEGTRIHCDLSGSGYGPSDQTSFYAKGIPVLHFFTGPHRDYHKTSDDTQHINAGGGVRVAQVVAGVAQTLSQRDGKLSYKRIAPELPAGDSRSFGASLGTIPDYAQGEDGKPGVVLSGVRPGGPAEKAGIRSGDRLLKIGSTEVRTVQDLVYVLKQASPGQKVTIEFERDGKKQKAQATFGESSRR
jgi:Tol biopolymer transport system component